MFLGIKVVDMVSSPKQPLQVYTTDNFKSPKVATHEGFYFYRFLFSLCFVDAFGFRCRIIMQISNF